MSLILCFTSHRSFLRHISFVSVPSLRLSCRLLNTRHWPNVRLLLAHRLRRWANISPVLGYRVVFDATLIVGQRHRQRASINPALASSSSYCTARARPDSIGLGLKVWRTNKRRQPDILATWSAGIQQGRIHDLKKEGAQGVWGLNPKIFLAHFGDFLKKLAQKGVGVRPLRPPSGSAPAQQALVLTIVGPLSTTLAQN